MNGISRDNLINCFEYLQNNPQTIDPLASVYSFLTTSEEDDVFGLSDADYESIDCLQKFCRNHCSFFNVNYFPMNYIVNSSIHLNHAIDHNDKEDSNCFYFNYDIPIRMNFVKEFITRCKAEQIPFNIKWDEKNNRKNSLIVYVSDKYLQSFIQILKDMSANNADYKTTQGLPDFCDKFNWFGYAKKPDLNFLQFESECAEVIESAIAKTMSEHRDWIKLRDGVSVESFAQELYKASRIGKTKSMPRDSEYDIDKVYFTIGLKDKFFVNYFNNNANDIYNRFIINDGFDTIKNSNGILDSCSTFDTALDFIRSDELKSHSVVEITPQMVMRTVFATCLFDIPEDQKQSFFDSVYNNAQTIANERGIMFTVPQCVYDEFASDNCECM